MNEKYILKTDLLYMTFTTTMKETTIDHGPTTRFHNSCQRHFLVLRLAEYHAKHWQTCPKTTDGAMDNPN